MANSKGTTNIRSLPLTGKQSHLPPKSPFPCIAPSYTDYGSSLMGSKGIPKSREGPRHHQRTSSESFLIEEQPSWLDDLLNEPETPVKKGVHRRSSSDSFAYLEATNNSPNIDNRVNEECKYKHVATVPSWGSPDFDHFRDLQHGSFYTDNSFTTQQNRGWESSMNSMTYPSSHPSGCDPSIMLQSSGPSCTPQKPDAISSAATEKQDQEEPGHDLQGSSERDAKPSVSETDTKRAKQQFAQRSRVRKLQYIAELERSVQALQAEGAEVLAQLEFLDQQNLILSMENKALKQRLDSLAQEKLIKHLEHEVLEREIARLRVLLYQQQQQQQQQPLLSAHHRRGGSRDLDSHFANLSLKHKEANSGREPVSGPLRT